MFSQATHGLVVTFSRLLSLEGAVKNGGTLNFLHWGQRSPTRSFQEHVRGLLELFTLKYKHLALLLLSLMLLYSWIILKQLFPLKGTN